MSNSRFVKKIQKIIGVFMLTLTILAGVFPLNVNAGALLGLMGVVYYVDDAGVMQNGDATTPNTFATARGYRTNLANNFAISTSPGIGKIFPAAESAGTDPAYFLWDVGSSAWVPEAVAGDIPIVVLETYAGLNGWTGASYVGASKKVMTQQERLDGMVVFMDETAVIEKIPTPTKVSATTGTITIGWQGLWDSTTGGSSGTANNTVTGYRIYRSVNNGTFDYYATVGQNRGGNITYNDNSVSVGNLYRYQISVMFDWGANTPNYYESTARSAVSLEMSPLIPEPDRVSFLTATQTIVAGNKSTIITFETRDTSGNTSPVRQDTTISLSSNSTGARSNPKFFEVSEGACSNVEITSILIPLDATQGQFCYYDEKSSFAENAQNRWTLTATKTSPASPAWINGNYLITVDPTDLAGFNLNMNSVEKNRVAFSGTNTITAYDTFGNLKHNFNAASNNVTLSSNPSSLDIYGLAGSGADVLNLASDFVNGVASLSGKMSVIAPTLGDYTFTATSADAKTGTSGTVTITAGNLHHFDFVLTSPQAIATVFSGTTNTLTAKDQDNHTVSDFNANTNNVTITELNNLGTVAGLGSGGNNVLNQAGSFVNGVANLTGSINYTGVIGNHTFKAVSGAVNSSSNSVMFTFGPLANFLLDFNSPEQNDKYFPNASITARDAGNNTVTNFDASTNSVTITSGGVIDLSDKDDAVLDLVSDFSAGIAVLNGKIKYTGVAGNVTITATSSDAKLGTASVTITAGDTDHVRINAQNGSAGVEITTLNLAAGSTTRMHAAAYDISNNFIANVNGTWSSDGTLDPVNVSGVSFIDFIPHTALTSGTVIFTDSLSRTDSTGNISVVAGAAATFTVVANTNATAGVPFSLTSITAYDAFGNVAVSYQGSKTISLSGAGNGPESGTPTSTITINFENGVATTFGSITLVKAETAKLTLAQGGITGQTGDITVVANTAQHLHVESPTPVIAGTAFEITTIFAHDQYGNSAISYSGSKNLTYSGPVASPSGSSPIYTTTVEFVNGASNTTLTTTLFKREQVSITVTEAGLSGISNVITINPAVARTIEKQAGDNQVGIAGRTLPTQISVLIKDIYGNTKNSQPVQYQVISGDGSVGSTSPTSDTNGVAQTTWTMGHVAGVNNNIVHAFLTDYPLEFVTFTASAEPALADSIIITAPGTAKAGVAFNVVITAVDELGNTASGYNGTKNINLSGASNAPAGNTPIYPVSVVFTNGVAGTVAITLFKAESIVLTGVIPVDALTGNSGAIDVSNGDAHEFVITAPASALVNTEFAINSIITRDVYENVALDYQGSKTLTYSGPANSVDGQAPSYTNPVNFENGVATTQLQTTLVQAESVRIHISEASVSGDSNIITVSFDNDFVLYYYSGNNQSGLVGSTLPNPFIVKVLDRTGQPAIGKIVDFHMNSGGAISNAYMVVNDQGYAQTILTLSTSSGTNSVVASVEGISNTVTFSAIVTAGQPTNLAFSKPNITVRVAAVSTNFNICLHDQYGNPTAATQDVSISFTSPSSNGSFAVDPAGSWNEQGITVPAGITCSANLYYKDSNEGTITLTANATSYSEGTMQVRVIPNNITRIEIVPATFTINYNQTKQLEAIAYDGDTVISDVTFLWRVADTAKGAVNQGGVYYPPRTAGTFTDLITASVGNVYGYATPTITAAPGETCTDCTNNTTTIIKTETKTIIQQAPPTIIREPAGNTYYFTININRNYYSDEDGEESLVVGKSNVPVILSPRSNSLVDNVLISGVGPENTILVIEDAEDATIGSVTTDQYGYWKLYVDREKISNSSATITARIQNSEISSSPIQFSVKNDNLFEILIEFFN